MNNYNNGAVYYICKKCREINGTVYLIRNIKTNKCYVGATTRDVSFRIFEHVKSDFELGNDLRTNYNDFDFVILAKNVKKKHILNQLECYYIGKYNCVDNGYNKTKGGTLTHDVYSIYNTI